MNLTMIKKSDNAIGYDFIKIVESRIMKRFKLEGKRGEEYVYEYEFECLVWNRGEEAELSVFMENDMQEIRDHYCLLRKQSE